MRIDLARNVVLNQAEERRIEPKIAGLIDVLAENAGNVVSRDQIIEQVWDGAFGADQSLNNAISHLRRVLEDLSGRTDLIETIPKRGYRLVADVEFLENEAISSSSHDEATSFWKQKPRFWLIASLASVLVGLISWLGAQGFKHNKSDHPVADLERETDATERASIAVLPFADLSSTEDQTYFSDGLSEEILNALANIDGLKVSSRTSSFSFRDNETVRVADIAETLGVEFVLEGSVRSSGDTVRITAQLIDARTDQHVWSETFERNMTAENLFAIQDEIAGNILQKMGLFEANAAREPTIWVRAQTDSFSAYDAFLKGREKFSQRRSTESTREGIQHFERAVELDPEFALAWAHLAGAYQVAPSWLLTGRDYDLLAEDAAHRAMDLNDKLALPLGVLGLQFVTRNPANYAEAFELFDEALGLEPGHASILIWRGIAHTATGDFDAAIRDFEGCLERDAASGACRNWLALAYLCRGEDDIALQMFERSAADGNRTHIGIFAQAFAVKGNERAALLTWAWDYNDKSISVERFYRAFNDPSFDFDAESRAFEREYQAEYGKMPEWGRAGAIDTAHIFKRYESLVPYNWYPVWWLQFHPDFAGSPHQKRLMIEHGLFAYWQEAGFPERCRPVGESDFVCD